MLAAMEILVLGGTRFVGRHIVEAALEQGHRVTTFTRGNNPLPGTSSLIGDRKTGNLEALRGHTWDAVIDVNAYFPKEVEQALEVLGGNVKHYAFISTVSVYKETAHPIDENSPVIELADPHTTELSGENYGGLKVICERKVQEAFGQNAFIVRPHLVVGPHDPTDRFTYWPRKFATQDRVMVPSKPTQTLQFVDARDLAAFVVQGLEQGLGGVFNGASSPVSWGDLVEACQKAASNASEAVWADEQWLLDQEVAPWSDLPAWIPSFWDGAGLDKTSNAKAQAAGFKMRPLQQTVEDVLQWDKARGLPELKAGLKAEREQNLIQQL